jgi:hypothetical protein
MFEKKPSTLVPTRSGHDPLAMLRQMTSEFERAFDDWRSYRWPFSGHLAAAEPVAWAPKIDVFEREGRLASGSAGDEEGRRLSGSHRWSPRAVG